MIVHGAIGVVRRNGLILIARRPAGKHLGGLWEFPGGRVEEGETAEAAIVREFREEVALDIVVTGKGDPIDWDYGDKKVHLDVFFCEAPTGEPDAVACDEVKWVAPADLKNYEFPKANSGLLRFLTK